jgi:hypothetical protein
MSAHAKLSPSGAHRWMRCPGSLTLEQGFPDTSSRFSAEGTLAHDVASLCLIESLDPHTLVGHEQTVDGFDFVVAEDMAAHVADYIKLVREYAEGGTLLIEKRVDFSRAVDVPESFGTSDAIILRDDELIVIDLKYGMGVRVDATDNEQLQLYALGALNDFGYLADFTMVTMVIHQPRLNHVSEWTITTEQLQAFAEDARLAAVEALDHEAPRFEAGEKQCRFCKAKAVCPALRDVVSGAVSGPATLADFGDLVPVTVNAETPADRLAMDMAKVELVEQWCKGVRAEVERRLLAGKPVEGYKLVTGRKGNRAWSDAAEVERLMKKSFRLRDDDVYDKVLISPTAAEKLLKDTPKRWAKVQDLISRSEGKPSVAPVTDNRPAMAVTSVADDFRGFLN